MFVRSTIGISLVTAFGLAATAWAGPPQINGTNPVGVPRGVETEIVVNGGNLTGNPRLIAPFGFNVVPPPAPNADAGNWKLKLVVDPATAVGVYPVRVQTDDGLSNPILVVVGQLPQVAEKEDNSTFETAQPIPAPVVVEGQSAGNDVDFFKFPGKKGQRIVVDAQCARIGSGVDPTVRLTTAGRVYVASADDTPGLLTDARLSAVLPEDGDYVVELSDSRYQGGGRAIYRLVIGAVPIADEVYPIGGRQGDTVGLELRGGSLPDVRVAAATLRPTAGFEFFPARITTLMLGLGGPELDVESLAPLVVGELPELREPADPAAPPLKAVPPVVLNGRIDPAGDEDTFTLAVIPGQKLHIEVEAAEKGSALDGVLQVLGANNAVQATADDTTIPATGKKGKAAGLVSADPTLDFTVPAGLTQIGLKLRDLEGRGGVGFAYRIVVTPIAPTFEITLNDAQVSVPKQGTAAIGVTVVRKEYAGPITLTVANPPPGLTVRPGTIADGQLVGALTVSAAPDAAFGAVNLQVVGQGQGPSGPIIEAAEKPLVFAQQTNQPINTVIQHGLAAAPALPTPVKLDAPATPVEVVHGYGAAVVIKAARAEGAVAALAVTPLPLPPGLTIPAANIAEKAAEGTVTVTAAPDTPPGAMSIALLAKGKFNNADQTFAVPGVTLTVVRPAALELATPAVEVKAGAEFELKGKIVRKAPFNEPVTVKVNGLPAGLKSDPATVAPGAADFTIKITADAKAPAATATGNVAIAYQVNKKDYPTTPTPLTVKLLPAQ